MLVTKGLILSLTVNVLSLYDSYNNECCSKKTPDWLESHIFLLYTHLHLQYRIQNEFQLITMVQGSFQKKNWTIIGYNFSLKRKNKYILSHFNQPAVSSAVWETARSPEGILFNI